MLEKISKAIGTSLGWAIVVTAFALVGVLAHAHVLFGIVFIAMSTLIAVKAFIVISSAIAFFFSFFFQLLNKKDELVVEKTTKEEVHAVPQAS